MTRWIPPCDEIFHWNPRVPQAHFHLLIIHSFNLYKIIINFKNKQSCLGVYDRIRGETSVKKLPNCCFADSITADRSSSRYIYRPEEETSLTPKYEQRAFHTYRKLPADNCATPGALETSIKSKYALRGERTLKRSLMHNRRIYIYVYRRDNTAGDIIGRLSSPRPLRGGRSRDFRVRTPC